MTNHQKAMPELPLTNEQIDDIDLGGVGHCGHRTFVAICAQAKQFNALRARASEGMPEEPKILRACDTTSCPVEGGPLIRKKDYDALRTQAAALLVERDGLRDLVKRWYLFNTEPAGLSTDIVRDKGCFHEFMDGISETHDELVAATKKHFSDAQLAAGGGEDET